jgi:hypothetical protein
MSPPHWRMPFYNVHGEEVVHFNEPGTEVRDELLPASKHTLKFDQMPVTRVVGKDLHTYQYVAKPQYFFKELCPMQGHLQCFFPSTYALKKIVSISCLVHSVSRVLLREQDGNCTYTMHILLGWPSVRQPELRELSALVKTHLHCVRTISRQHSVDYGFTCAPEGAGFPVEHYDHWVAQIQFPVEHVTYSDRIGKSQATRHHYAAKKIYVFKMNCPLWSIMNQFFPHSPCYRDVGVEVDLDEVVGDLPTALIQASRHIRAPHNYGEKLYVPESLRATFGCEFLEDDDEVIAELLRRVLHVVRVVRRMVDVDTW